MDTDTSDFSAGDFESAASAIASPDTSEVETSEAAEATTDVVDATGTDEATDEPDAEVPDVPTPKGPPIPLEVHRKSLENARVKGGEEAVAKYREKYGWAETIAQPDLQRWGETANRINQDPEQFADDYLTELENHPRYAASIRQKIADRAAAYRSQQQATQPPQPDVQIVDERGQVVGMTYSDKQLPQLLAQVKADAIKEVQQQLAPLNQMRAQAEERERFATVNAKVDAQLAEASKWPHFLEHQQAIGVEVQKGRSLEDAYNAVYVRDITPRLASLERKSVLGQLRHKVAAGTVSPTSGVTSVSAPDSQKSFEQLFHEKASLLGL